jgi:hypothetical protein
MISSLKLFFEVSLWSSVIFCTPLGAADVFVCPQSLMVKQKISEDVDGWSAFDVEGRYPFVGVSFSLGAPDQKNIFAPSSEKRSGSYLVSSWVLPPSKESYWVSCLYSGTSVSIAQKLRSTFSSCTVEYDGRFSMPVVKAWQCTED